MNRRMILKGLGTLGLTAILPAKGAFSSPEGELRFLPDCILAPQEVEGPFYFDAAQIREDIIEDRKGMKLQLALTIVDADCKPIPNAMVDVWHADKDGLYSGYTGQGDGRNIDTRGLKYLRGIQMTDNNGQVGFTTIYPGWYQGRVAHLHFKIHFNDQTFVTSQLYFPEEITKVVYGSNLYEGRGQGSARFSNDIVLNADREGFGRPQDLESLLMTVEEQEEEGYLATHTVGINTVVSKTKSSKGTGELRLNQNFPNPFEKTTNFRFALARRSKVQLNVLNLAGSIVANLLNEQLIAGEHLHSWDREADEKRFASGVYLFELRVENEQGVFSKSRRLIIQ